MDVKIAISYLEDELKNGENQLLKAERTNCKKKYVDFLNKKNNQFRNAIEILKLQK